MKKAKDFSQNTYTPPMAVCDEKRNQWFTTYNVELMNRIRAIKLNQVR